MDNHVPATNPGLGLRFLNMVRSSPDYRQPEPAVGSWAPQLQEIDYTYMFRHHGSPPGSGEHILDGPPSQHRQFMELSNSVKQLLVFARLSCKGDRLFVAEFDGEPHRVRLGYRESALPLAPNIEVRPAPGRLIGIYLYDGDVLNAEQLAGIEERLCRRHCASRFIGKGYVDIPLPGTLHWETEPDVVTEDERAKVQAEIERLGPDEAFQHSLRDHTHPKYAENNAYWAKLWNRANPPGPRTRVHLVTCQGNLACGEAAERYSLQRVLGCFGVGESGALDQAGLKEKIAKASKVHPVAAERLLRAYGIDAELMGLGSQEHVGLLHQEFDALLAGKHELLV